MEHLKSPSLVYLMWSFFDLMEWKNQSIEATTSSEHVFEIVASSNNRPLFVQKKNCPRLLFEEILYLKYKVEGF